MHLAKHVRRVVPLVAVVTACACALAASAAAQSGTLGHSGRFYTIDGQPTVLLGMDMQELAANPQVDYLSILDDLSAHQVNAVRLWIYPYWSPSGYLQPWTYGVCAAGKYDLDTWNPAYWTRLQAVVDAAQARGIYVELSLFPANLVDDSSWPSTSNHAAWNEAYNCNGEFAGNPAGSFVPQFWNPDPASPTYVRQKQLVDKVLATFPYASYKNVSFEISNEFPGRNTQASPAGSNSQATNPDLPAWQNSWIDYIKANDPGRVVSAYAQDYVGTNTNGIESYWNRPNVDILDFHSSRVDPNAVMDMLNDGAQTKGKILQDNETTTNQYGNETTTDVSTQRAWAWNMNLGYFKWYWDSSQLAPADPQFAPALQRLEVMANIDREVGWTALSDIDPSGAQYDSLVSAAPSQYLKVLANPDAGRYLYYGWGSSVDEPLQINLAAGLYLYRWIDTRNGSALVKGFVPSAGGTTAIAQTSSWNANAGVVLTAVPASKDDCKDGGWTTFDTPVFKNQGDCVSYVATGGQH